MNGYDPDANIMMIVGPAEEEWYRAGMAAHASAAVLRETAASILPAEMFVRVRRRAEPVYYVRVRRQSRLPDAKTAASLPAAGMARTLCAALH